MGKAVFSPTLIEGLSLLCGMGTAVSYSSIVVGVSLLCGMELMSLPYTVIVYVSAGWCLVFIYYRCHCFVFLCIVYNLLVGNS